MTSVFLYFPDGRLSAAELTAACLDGHLVGLGEGYVPADTVETPSLRAASLHALAGTQLAVVLESAAWVHGVLDDPPSRHRLQRASVRRLHEPIARRFVYRDPQLPAADVVVMGGVAVTTPGRTVADLARTDDASAAHALAAYAQRDPEALAAGARWLQGAGRVPHKRAALDRIAGLRTM
jgi:hypothetical protein